MKKVLAIILASLVCIFVTACGNSTNTGSNTPVDTDAETSNIPAETTEKVTATELVLATPNTVNNYADFTLFKVITGKKVTASLGGGIYYENDNNGETYVDIILDWTNTSAETVRCDEIVIATATNNSGTEYNNCLYTVETNNGTYLSQYENIAPLSTVRLHCSVSVPESETELTLKLTANKKDYIFGYSLGEIASSAKEIKVGDTINAENFADLMFTGIEYTNDLLPSNTSGYYRHYEIDNTSNTYLVVKFDITNYMDSARDCDTFAGVKALYMNKYTYTGFVVVEDTDGKGFSSYEDISPLSTRHFYYLIEVPTAVVDKELNLTISFNGQEYTYISK